MKNTAFSPHRPAASEQTGVRAQLRRVPFALLSSHVAAVAGIVLLGWSWSGLALAVGMYFLRMIVVTAGYHRYFSHRTFSTSRAFQFLLAVGAQSAAQRGVLWWASHHRWHHKYSDRELDVHSAKQRGFFHAHMGWLFADTWDSTDPKLVPDLYKFPELRWLDRTGVDVLPTIALALVCLFVGGLHGLVWGFFVSMVMVWHGSFAINSFAHVFGPRRYATGDESRNNWLLAILTCGEGWHNNHHHYPGSVRQGFFWWEVDLTFYVLRGLELLGLVWNLRGVPDRLLAGPLFADAGPDTTGPSRAQPTARPDDIVLPV
jgi:stearoyl-CoA desaturase (Delta-9 desaturase)